MRRAGIVLLAVMMCAGYSFGQTSGVPQWKVIKGFHAIEQTATIPKTVILTPSKDELYRCTAHMALSYKAESGGYNFFLNWTDRTGQPWSTSLGVNIFNNVIQDLNGQLFAPKPGTPVTISV